MTHMDRHFFRWHSPYSSAHCSMGPSLGKANLGWRQSVLVLILILGVAAVGMYGLALGQSQELSLDNGASGLAQALARLPFTTRVLFIAAHPDDEPAGLLTFFSRGLHAKTALLSLTRGEGGQNLVSPDQAEALGLLRTGELLAADEYYGAEQYFTRAFDFGFSRSAEETLRLWDRKVVLSDVVRVIREFRPDLIVSVWQGNAQDGHGHHQASGILAQEAYRVSGDPSQFPDQGLEGLAPWRARMFFVLKPSEKSGLLQVNTGEYVPLFGASFQQIGVKGYSFHRTQGAGNSHASAGDIWQELGRLFSESTPSTPSMPVFRASTFLLSQQARTAEFASLVSTLDDLPDMLKSGDPQQTWLKDRLGALKNLIEEAQEGFTPNDFRKTFRPLLEGLDILRQIRQRLAAISAADLPANRLVFLIEDKQRDFQQAIGLALGLSLEALADEPTPTPGHSFTVSVRLVNRSSVVLHPMEIRLLVNTNWRIGKMEGELAPLHPQEKMTVKFPLSASLQEFPTRLPLSRSGARATMYSISEKGRVNEPLPPPPVRVQMEYSISDFPPRNRPPVTSGSDNRQEDLSTLPLSVVRPVEYLDSDRLKGTRRVPLLLVPSIFVNVTPSLQLVPRALAKRPVWVRVELINNTSSRVSGQVRLHPPAGWSVQPLSQSFTLPEKGKSDLPRFQVIPPDPLPTSPVSFAAVAEVDGQKLTSSCRMISAFDLWIVPLYKKAESEVVPLDVQVAGKTRVGYIMGAGDRVPEVLEQIGAPVTLLETEELARGDLHRYSSIVAGVRAYDVRKDLIALNSRLLQYVADGGTYVVQYNTPDAWNRAQYGPYPARIRSSGDRVTDETAPVTILDPKHPLFNFPNKIGKADFDGWVQERGLYFLQDRDAHYKALLSCHDPGEPPLDGGLLVAEYGKGLYVLTAYSWFRQLPAGIPGAVRIFANLISLAQTRNRDSAARSTRLFPEPTFLKFPLHLSPLPFFPYPWYLGEPTLRDF